LTPSDEKPEAVGANVVRRAVSAGPPARRDLAALTPMLLLLSVAVACLALASAVLLARHVRELERLQAQIDLRLARLEGDFEELRR
jgi:hypothetical protein